MRGRKELREQLEALNPELTREYPSIGIFGSVARGQQSDTSDLDLLVAFDGPVSLFDVVRLEQELESRLEMEVDVVTKGSLTPRIGERVAEDLVEV